VYAYHFILLLGHNLSTVVSQVPKAAEFGNIKMDINLIKCILLEFISFFFILK
jgi:hypothetical protein